MLVLALAACLFVACGDDGSEGGDTTKKPDVTTEAPSVTTQPEPEVTYPDSPTATDGIQDDVEVDIFD